MENFIYSIFVSVLLLLAIVQEKIAFHNADLRSRLSRKNYTVLLLGSFCNIIWPVFAVVRGMSILSFLTVLYVFFS